LAAGFLEGLGYQILARNYRSSRKEIDLVVLDHRELVFVEVKAGKSRRFGEPVLRVDASKQDSLALVAQGYLAENKLAIDGCRWDVVTVNLITGKMEHYKSAFILPEQL
jgi:putative endonuclease